MNIPEEKSINNTNRTNTPTNRTTNTIPSYQNGNIVLNSPQNLVSFDNEYLDNNLSNQLDYLSKIYKSDTNSFSSVDTTSNNSWENLSDSDISG